MARLTRRLLQICECRSKKAAPDWLGGLTLTMMILWFTQDIVFGGKVPFFRDLGTYFYPLRFSLAQSLQAGELPLWDNRLAMGFPVFANPQAGVFYPPHLAFVAFSFFSAIRFLFVLHYFIAALGTFILLRRWDYPVYLAIVGSVLFSFGGLVVSLSNLLDHFQSAVWLPWVLLCAERAFQRRTLNSILLLAVVSALQFLAGSPEIYLMTATLVLADGLRMRSADHALTIGRELRVIIGANLFTAGLTMVQLLPTLELYSESWRSEGLSLGRMAAWSLDPIRLLNLFFLDKEINLQAFDGIDLYFGRDVPLLISLYSGVAVLGGFCLWLSLSSCREKITILGLIGISLLLSIGKHASAYALVFQYLAFVPIRFPEKFLGFTLVFLLFTALTGFSRFVDGQNHGAKRPGLTVLWGVVLMIAGLYIFLYLDLRGLVEFIARTRHHPVDDVTNLPIAAAVMVQLERQFLLAVAIAGLFSFWKARKVRGPILQILLVGVAFFDLATAHRFYSLGLNPGVVGSARPVLTSSMQDEGRFFYMIRSGDIHPNAYALNKKSFHDTISFAFAGLIPNTGIFYGVGYLQELDALRRKPYEYLLRAADKFTPEQLLRLLGALHVRYVHSFEPLSEHSIKLLRFAPEYPMRLYEIENVIPRVFLASEIVVENDPAQALARLSSVGFDPRREVILEERIGTNGYRDLQGHAEIRGYTNTSVKIRSKLTTPGVLVLTDAYYPGWKLYVDGKESKLLRANLFFRGVVLEPGEHSIEFHFRPLSFSIGAFISVLTLCGVAGRVVLVAARKRGSSGTCAASTGL